MCFVMRGKHTVYGPLPSCLTRLRPYFDNPSILTDLRRMGFDVWVGLLVVIGSAGYHDLEDFFFGVYLESLTGNDIREFRELLEHLEACIWISQPMDLYAWQIWKETPVTFMQRSEQFSGEGCPLSHVNHQDLVPRWRCVPSTGIRPISLLGFPAFKLDHTDSTAIRE